MTAMAADFRCVFGGFTMRATVLAVRPSRAAAILVSALLCVLHIAFLALLFLVLLLL